MAIRHLVLRRQTCQSHGIWGQRRVCIQHYLIRNPFHDYTLSSRVHISEATYQFLNGAYEIDPWNGQERDAYLREHNVVSYLIRQTEPKRPRRRLASRPRYMTLFLLFQKNCNYTIFKVRSVCLRLYFTAEPHCQKTLTICGQISLYSNPALRW